MRLTLISGRCDTQSDAEGGDKSRLFYIGFKVSPETSILKPDPSSG